MHFSPPRIWKVTHSDSRSHLGLCAEGLNCPLLHYMVRRGSKPRLRVPRAGHSDGMTCARFASMFEWHSGANRRARKEKAFE